MTTSNQTLPTRRIPKATIYVEGVFGYSTLEVNDLEIKSGPYAQYNNAVFLEYRKKRARKTSRLRRTLSYRPAAVVVEGWGHPKFDSFGPSEISETGLIVSQGLHSSCSPEWQNTFSTFLASNGLTPVVDLHGWDSHSGGWSNRPAA